jgi:hypothetical protein
LKPQYDETLSNLAFNFNLRRYMTATGEQTSEAEAGQCSFTVSTPVLKAPMVSAISA